MTIEEMQELERIVLDKPWLTHKRLTEYLKTVSVEQGRTGLQNNALHKGLELIAQALNDAGLDIRATLKPEVEIPWTKETVKEYLFRPVMKLATGKESTKQLSKVGEIEKVWDIVMRHLSQNHGIEYIPFPSNESVGLTQLKNLKNDDYPEYDKAPTF